MSAFSFAYLLIIQCALSSPPISDPKSYDLIDTDPNCYSAGNCDAFTPGSSLGYFPNSEERFQHLLRNLFRMHANESISTTLGRKLEGVKDEDTYYHRSPEYTGDLVDSCGSTYFYRKPLYWYSDANQLARYTHWNHNTCDVKSTFYSSHSDHETCPDASDYIDDTDYKCSNFVSYSIDYDYPDSYSCSLEARRYVWNAMQDEADGSNTGSYWAEGFWASNFGMKSGHCSVVFESVYDYIGVGFYPGTNDAVQVFSKWNTETSYPIPIVSHFDERNKIYSTDRTAATPFNLMLEWYDRDGYYADTVYALYDGKITEMSVYLKENKFDVVYSGFFQSKFEFPSDCEPYAFVVKNSNGEFYRMPENDEYYFGTVFEEWSWWADGDYPVESNTCEENHYYIDSNDDWIANGGPTLTVDSIDYYTNGGSCIGCSKIDTLECLYICIIEGTIETTCDCATTPTIDSTPEPTVSTPEPTTADPTTAEPTTAEPTTDEPTTAEPTTAEPITDEPITAEPTTAEPTTAEPTTAEPTNAEPTTDEPTTAEPTTEEPITAEPITAEPTTDEPTNATPSPTTAEPTTAEPITDEPITAEPTGATPAPTHVPTDVTAAPTEPTLAPVDIPTRAPTNMPTAVDMTCTKIVLYNRTWPHSHKDWSNSKIRNNIQSCFTNEYIYEPQECPECDPGDGSYPRYYYHTYWTGKPAKLYTVWFIICVDGVFGQYSAESGFTEATWDLAAATNDNQWTDPNAFTWVQYAVYGLIIVALFAICVIVMWYCAVKVDEEHELTPKVLQKMNVFVSEMQMQRKGFSPVDKQKQNSDSFQFPDTFEMMPGKGGTKGRKKKSIHLAPVMMGHLVEQVSGSMTFDDDIPMPADAVAPTSLGGGFNSMKMHVHTKSRSFDPEDPMFIGKMADGQSPDLNDSKQDLKQYFKPDARSRLKVNTFAKVKTQSFDVEDDDAEADIWDQV